MPTLLQLSKTYPDLRFEVTLTGRRLDLVEDEIDVAVREGALTDSSLVARLLFPAIVGLYASPAYLKAHRAPRTLADLSRHDLLLLPRSNIPLPRGVRKLALTPRFQVDDLFAVAELAESGAGLVALPDYMADARVSRGSLVRVLPKTDVARFPVHAVYPSRRHLPRRVEVVIYALSNARLPLR
jgi:DNA-binding transcriptional LysR family regulator